MAADQAVEQGLEVGPGLTVALKVVSGIRMVSEGYGQSLHFCCVSFVCAGDPTFAPATIADMKIFSVSTEFCFFPDPRIFFHVFLIKKKL